MLVRRGRIEDLYFTSFMSNHQMALTLGSVAGFVLLV